MHGLGRRVQDVGPLISGERKPLSDSLPRNDILYFDCRFAAPFNSCHCLVPWLEDSSDAIIGRDNPEVDIISRTDDGAVKNVWVDWGEIEGVATGRGIGG